MEHKAKECKGIGKAKGVKGCNTPSFNRKFGLCPTCLYEWATSNDNGKVWYNKQFIPKVNKVTKQRKKEEDKKSREDLKSISRLIQEARVPFQKWIRLRDANYSCAACGDVKAEIWHGSHMYKAELYTGLIFDERNVHKCCNKCNVILSGNESAFITGISKRYGQEYVNGLKEDSYLKRTYKFTRQELYDIKKKYQKKIKELK